ncbi:hypothetical protein NC651_007094 [Populus alba x Populus x berolinensis]|nr:hypothetical protein NC651_007094 [Populus alba x Populus x berolinensis]
MTTSRQAYKIDENNPGSDLAGETTAAMAAASIVFKGTNPHYSHLLLHHAQQLFDFGDKYRGKYDESVGVVKSYYASMSGYKDELLWGAMWLYKATGDDKYLEYVIDNAHCLGGIGWAMTEFSWDVKYAGLQIMASKLLEEEKHKGHRDTLEQYRSKAEYYICSCLNKNNGSNVNRTPVVYCTSGNGTTCNMYPRQPSFSLYTPISFETRLKSSSAMEGLWITKRYSILLNLKLITS